MLKWDIYINTHIEYTLYVHLHIYTSSVLKTASVATGSDIYVCKWYTYINTHIVFTLYVHIHRYIYTCVCVCVHV